MKKIDILTQFSKTYSYENYVAKQLQNSFQKLGIPFTHICLQDGNFGEYLREFKKKIPYCTLSLVDLFIGNRLACDEFEVPHLIWSRNGLSESLHYLSRPLGWVGISDQALARQMKSWGYPRTTFLPPAVDPSLKGLLEEERCYDVVFFEDLIDIDYLEKIWKDVFPPLQLEILYQSIQVCQKNPTFHPLEALFTQLSLRNMKIVDVQFSELLSGIEEYLKAGFTLRAIESLTCKRIDVFGNHMGNNWLKRLRNGQNVYLHGALPYTEHFEVLKRSKVVVRLPVLSQAHFDEWALPALLQGCMAVQQDTPFSRQLFSKVEHGFYSLESFSINELVNRHLDLRNATKEMLNGIRDELLKKNTWDDRAMELMETIS